jgi:Protein of unknown function (DUF1488)
MSLRFNRNTQPTWNEHKSRIEFVCTDSITRTAVPCAVSRAALEDTTGETVDSAHAIPVFSRHLARVISAANSMYATDQLEGGVVLVDSDQLFASIMPHVAAAEGAQLAHHV